MKTRTFCVSFHNSGKLDIVARGLVRHILTLQVSGLLHARAFVEEALDMAVQHAFVGQHLINVDFIEPFHVGGKVFDFVVGGGLSRPAAVHGYAAQRG